MNYVSTRGQAPTVSFLDAVLTGLAPDGGLYVPESWPQLTKSEIAAFAGRPYAEVAAKILRLFAGPSVDEAALFDMCADAYASFSHTAVAPLKQLSPGGFLLELFHGPTLAFKDVALQLLARLYDHALARAGGGSPSSAPPPATPAGPRWRPSAAAATCASWRCSPRGASRPYSAGS
jgi:threonine synthase